MELPEIQDIGQFISVEASTKPNAKDPFAKALTTQSFDGLSQAARKRIQRRVNKAATGVSDAGSKKTEVDSFDAYSIFSVIQPPYNLDYLAQLYEADPTNYPAINAKVANTVALGYDFIPSDRTLDLVSQANTEEELNSLRRKLELGKRRINNFLDNCNSEMTFGEVLVNVMLDYESTGNGYIEIGRTSAGGIGYIGHIPSKTVRVRRERDGFVQIVGRRAIFFRNFRGDAKDPVNNDPTPNEIIHFRKFTPANSYYGIPDIVPALNSALGHKFATQYNIDYFENKAVPRYVVVVKGAKVSEALQQDIFSFFSNHLRGQNHRSMIIPLPADTADAKTSFEMKPVEAGTQDASFDKYLKHNIYEILAAHRVPISKISISAGVSLAQARDADKTFKEQVTRPIQQKIEKKLAPVFAMLTNAFVFKLNELSLTDEDTQSKIDERYLRLGVIVPNEVRNRKGMSAIEGGDKQVPISPQGKAEMATQASGNRQRDQQRQANSPDNSGEGRNEQGAGRQQE